MVGQPAVASNGQKLSAGADAKDNATDNARNSAQRSIVPGKIHVTFRLVHGGLTQVRAPVAIAPRYDGLPLAGSTMAFDQMLDSWLKRAIELGIVGSGLGQLFPVNVQNLYDEGKINARWLLLASMGEPGRFARDDLRFLMCNITVVVKSLRQDLFATTLLGTRRREMSVEDAVRGLLEGIADGYERFAAIVSAVTLHRGEFEQAAQWPLTIALAEPDKGKLAQIKAVIEMIEGEKTLSGLELDVVEDPDVPFDKDVKEGAADDTSPYVPISLLRIMPKSPVAAAGESATADDKVFQFSGLSESAVVPVREMSINPYLAREIPARMSSARTTAEQRAKLSVLFADLLIPDDFRRTLEGAQGLTLEVDESTAIYPWEMLARTCYSRTSYIGTDVPVSRQFRTLDSPLTAPPSSPPALNNKLRVLIIADPASKRWPLPKAREEGSAVVEILDQARKAWGGLYDYDIKVSVRLGSPDDDDVLPELENLRQRTALVNSAERCDPVEIIMQIVNGTYDVIHYAGHGFFEPKTGRAGWLLSPDCRLTASEIFRVRQVPRLVFANACFSAAMPDLDHNDQRRHLASLARAFFLRGIPNFIGTGWEVDDACAIECARWFYARALGLRQPGKSEPEIPVTAPPATIGHALRVARQNALERNEGSSSWGAYQHYGRTTDKLLPFHNLDRFANGDGSQPAKAEALDLGGLGGQSQSGEAKSGEAKSGVSKSKAMASVQTASEPDPSLVYINGIDVETGNYAVTPRSLTGLAKQVLARPGVDRFDALHAERPRSFALVFGVDLDRLDDAGWGIVFHEATPPDVRNALEPLIAHRRSQTGDRFKILDYKGGEQTRGWYQRHNISAGSLDPQIVPFYLLLIGPPDLIPFEFQYLLGVEYAVGRLAFATAAEYQRYVQSVVDYEAAASLPNAKQIAYWATHHESDPATAMSASMLIGPLAKGMPGAAGALKRPIHEQVGYDCQLCLGEEATKDRLLATLHGPKPPAFLFTASHGMAVPAGNAKQAAVQGALLCQDWPGFGSVRPAHFLAAGDIADDANVKGLVAFLFACFGNGTPDQDQFPMDLSQAANAPPLAPKPFLAALPQRLLAHPNGGALAVVGHIDRAWGFSIQAPKVAEPQIGAFRSTLGFVMDGKPIGYALGGTFGARFASLSTALATATSPTAPANARLGDQELVTLWLQRNDAQNYLLLGDPAAHIRKESFT